MKQYLYLSFNLTKASLIILLTLLATSLNLAAKSGNAISPNGKLKVVTNGKGYTIYSQQQRVLEMPAVGYGENAKQLSFTQCVKADYHMLTGKRLHCFNEANEYEAILSDQVRMIMRLYNDGIAFRYQKTASKGQAMPEKEQTTYQIPEGTRRWMQQWTDAYEGFFPLTTSYKTKAVHSFSGVFTSAEGWNIRWGYPALLQSSNNLFALITEANIERGQSASCLYNDGEYFRVTPDETTNQSTFTPWRVILIGSLADIVQSTLVTDVSEPCRLTDTDWIQPGVVSWIYWAYNHGSNDYNIIKKYVDFADTLKLPYVLIDAEWDEMKDGKTIEDAIAYARSKGVKPLIWYNSSVGWVDGAPGPKYRLNDPESREREFAWCQAQGIVGVKIDFFSGDNQKNMDYCIDLLECAARHHLLVNFHGATIPRGWQRTYPNLLSTEGVYGAEWYNNVPTFTDRAASHNATLPFTRNVIGPMDYTPCAFSDSQHPHITTHAHELALTVLYESGLQHLADRPESFLSQPDEVKQFLSHLPTVWDETCYISGYPGDCVVLARKSGSTWYVAGINGTDSTRVLSLESLPDKLKYQGNGSLMLFADGNPWQITRPTSLPREIRCQPRGGFIILIKQ